jgi:hypothetical protein
VSARYQHELSVSQCKRIAVEILEGESQLAGDAVKLRALIARGSVSEKSPDPNLVYQPTRHPAKRSRVGLRNATRDRVGTGERVG